MIQIQHAIRHDDGDDVVDDGGDDDYNDSGL